MNEVIRLAKKNPSPDYKVRLANWAEDGKSLYSHGHLHKDEFPKGKRMTIPEQVYKDQKKRKIPAPGAYDPKNLDKIPDVPKSSVPKDILHQNTKYEAK